MKNKISIIIVNFNGKKWLDGCLTSLSKQTYINYEIILVDNASTDDSVKFVKVKFPKVKVVVNTKNIGFAGGNNRGYKEALGDYILLLNNDVKVDKVFLAKFLESFRKNPAASIVQSKIVEMSDPGIIDSCGSYWTDSSLLYYIGNGKNADAEKYNRSFRIFSTKGASMMIKRDVIEKIGLFNDYFWNYYEETDFCHRAWISGFECWYSPEATCYHANGGTSLTFKNDFIQFHNFKNKLTSFVTNFEVKKLIFIIPTFLTVNLLLSAYWVLMGKFGHSLSLIMALVWNVKYFRKILKSRKTIQKLRMKKDDEYLKIVKRNPTLRYYYFLLKDNLGLYFD